MTLTHRIKSEAHRLGFQLVGVTSPDPPPHYSAFEHWLTAGRHGELAYLSTDRSRQRRADPRLILPECQSILILGMQYPFICEDEEACEGGAYWGRVASYAWGEDYHLVFEKLLNKLVDSITNIVGRHVLHRWYADTGPIMERDLAQRAGLGWIGKNTCLINPSLGSYFLLAEILLNLDLDLDPPFMHDRCGSCRRCLDTCPTGCILPDRALDARRCISYLTIELKGVIPLDLRERVGDWVFGCDICQLVCPWNQRVIHRQEKVVPNKENLLSQWRDVSKVDLISELSLDQKTFSSRFKSSPVKRAKWRGYLRNAAITLGNRAARTKDIKAVQALGSRLLEDAEPLVRLHAAWALGRVGGEMAYQYLFRESQAEKDFEVLIEIKLAMRQFSS